MARIENVVFRRFAGRTSNREELQKQVDLLKSNSMMTWQHVNMHGKYDFNEEVNTSPFDLNIVKSLNINKI